MRNSDEVEQQAKHCPVAGVDGKLQNQITAEPATGVVQSLGHEVQLAVSGEPEGAVAQVLALSQHKESKNNYDRGSLKRTSERTQEGTEDPEPDSMEAGLPVQRWAGGK